jgi:hypothetical protein
MLFNSRKNLKNFLLVIILVSISLIFAGCTATEKSLSDSTTSEVQSENNADSDIKEKNTNLDNNEENTDTVSKNDNNEDKIEEGNNTIESKNTDEGNLEKKVVDKEDTKETSDAEQSIDNEDKNNEEEIKELTFNSITFDQLHPLTLDEVKPFTEREVRFKNHTFPTIGAYYNEDWRYQVVEINGYGSKPKAVIDIGNTGDKPLILTDENICFILMSASGGSGNISGSKLHNAPVTINPGEIKRVTITANNPEARSLEFRFSGEDYVEVAISDYNEKITDTTPYENFDEYGVRVGGTTDFLYPSAGAEDTICGNGKFKYLVDKVIITDLEQVGGIKRPEGGAILLVKVVLANTTDETMKINWVATQAVVIEGERKTIEFEYTDKEWKVLGSKALPRVIKPNQIVEGYVALPFYRGRDSHAVLFKSTHGWFVIDQIESYPVAP